MRLAGVVLRFDTSGEGVHQIVSDRVLNPGEILEECRGSYPLDEMIDRAEQYVRDCNDVPEWVYMRRITPKSEAYDAGEDKYDEESTIVAYRFYC